MADTVFRGVLVFFEELGVYDVVLPFLLVFSIVYAIFEKTRVLGVEEIDGKQYSKKNLNAIISFVVSFFVVASTKLVAAINSALANIALLLLLVVFFLLLVGAFFKEGEGVFLEKGGWRTLFMTMVFVGIILIFLDALNWLRPFIDYIMAHWETRWVGSFILIILIIFFMWFITKSPAPTSSPAPEPKKEE